MNSALHRKICILGDFCVGKTSLVSRLLMNSFSETYLTTVGIRINTASFSLAGGRILKMVLWDTAGAHGYGEAKSAALKGVHGLVFVADGRRHETLASAVRMRRQALEHLGRDTPNVLLISHNDEVDDWEVAPQDLRVSEKDGPVFSVSAKTGSSVSTAFLALAEVIA